MSKPEPIACGEKKAASMFDLSPKDFRALVDDGTFPKPKRLGGCERWDIAELKAIFRGEKVDGFEDVQW